MFLSFQDVTDMTLRASGNWLGTRTGAGGTATLLFLVAPNCSMENRSYRGLSKCVNNIIYIGY